MRQLLTFLTILFVATSCSGQADNKEDKEVIIDPIIPQPQFPGQSAGLKKYLKENYNWRQGQLTVEGTVYVDFIVLEDGSISDAKVFKGLCTTCDAEALRLVKKMPKWVPAEQDGKPKREKVVLPIKFSLGTSNPYE